MSDNKNISGGEKKPFNKKKWREQKYSSKAKVKKWEDNKRKAAQRELSKEYRKQNLDFKKDHVGTHNNRKKEFNKFKEAQLQFKALQQMKEEKRKEAEKIKQEKIEAIKARKLKRAERFKKLSQKTRKGQPLMKGRIELLLEKIQKHYVNNSS